jgi:cytoskeletal protein CcmA (bactofilin family)
MSIRSASATEYLEPPDAVSEGDTFSVIDRHSAFDGTFRADRDLRIEGEVKGTIECQGTLFVAQGATVQAQVNAENVTVAGDLNGEIRCHGRLQLMPSGQVRGKVATETLVIDEGAFYEGQLEMPAPEDRGKAPRPISAGVGPIPLAAPGAEPSGRGAGSTTFIRRLGQPETAWAGDPNDQPRAADGDDEEGASRE